ncbi:MAG TPA: quinol:cytochrome C oxidoreductase [Polyangia bacterium]
MSAHLTVLPTLTPESVSLPPAHGLRRLPLIAGAAGAVGLVVAAGLGLRAPERFYHAYLTAFLFGLSLGLGALCHVLIQLASRAGSSVIPRRLAEIAMASLPVFALLFIPVVVGAGHLYEWTRHHEVARDALLQHKQPYLNLPFFALRAVIYFALWAGAAWYVWRQTTAQDRTRSHAITRRLQRLSPVALLVFAVTVTLAAIDWIMALYPHWFSTIFGLYYFAGSMVGNYALMILLALLVQRGGMLTELITPHHYHDLGKWLFAFTCFWAYMAFSQYMLIWYGNIPEETVFYARRWEGGFKVATTLLVLGHFAVPFFLLLARGAKRSHLVIGVAAVWMLAAHYLDIYWLVMPAMGAAGAGLRLVDAAALVGIGGVFLAVMAWLMRRHPLVPVGDPRLHESLAFVND